MLSPGHPAKGRVAGMVGVQISVSSALPPQCLALCPQGSRRGWAVHASARVLTSDTCFRIHRTAASALALVAFHSACSSGLRSQRPGRHWAWQVGVAILGACISYWSACLEARLCSLGRQRGGTGELDPDWMPCAARPLSCSSIWGVTSGRARPLPPPCPAPQPRLSD